MTVNVAVTGFRPFASASSSREGTALSFSHKSSSCVCDSKPSTLLMRLLDTSKILRFFKGSRPSMRQMPLWLRYSSSSPVHASNPSMLSSLLLCKEMQRRDFMWPSPWTVEIRLRPSHSSLRSACDSRFSMFLILFEPSSSVVRWLSCEMPVIAGILFAARYSSWMGAGPRAAKASMEWISLYENSSRRSLEKPGRAGISFSWLSLNSKSSRLPLQAAPAQADTSVSRFCRKLTDTKPVNVRMRGSMLESLFAVRSNTRSCGFSCTFSRLCRCSLVRSSTSLDVAPSLPAFMLVNQLRL
mmetsp:Transcript_20140/g.56079  ORF Transcript_20140/g.56079 Transcript_20140/m.56079 type:complete len:299 (-) Transcript_20140:67-963(-)